MEAPIQRRTILALLGTGIVASRLQAMQHAMHGLSRNPEKYELAFFTAEQDKLVDRLADLIIPADDVSQGAHAARVSYYIDLILANSSADAQTEFQTGMMAFEEFATRAKAKPFLALSTADQEAVLTAIAPKLPNASQPEEQFFATMKRLTLAGFYTSRVGLIDDLGYKGNQVLGSYPGCEHRPGTH